jgi:YHS domain-containing protein
MKSVQTLSIIALLAAGALAFQSKKLPKPETPKTKVHCPVMSANVVDVAQATKSKLYLDYKGRRYLFCCGGCPAAFKASPEKYKNAESIPIPKPKPKGK